MSQGRQHVKWEALISPLLFTRADLLWYLLTERHLSDFIMDVKQLTHGNTKSKPHAMVS